MIKRKPKPFFPLSPFADFAEGICEPVRIYGDREVTQINLLRIALGQPLVTREILDEIKANSVPKPQEFTFINVVNGIERVARTAGFRRH